MFLLDPGYMCPEGVETRLEVRLPERGFQARDLLTGNALSVQDGTVPVDVQAGAFRVVEIHPGDQ